MTIRRAILGASLAALAAPVFADDRQSMAMMGVDLGAEFFKVSLIKDRKFDIALNIESKRKTDNAVSFNNQVREFSSPAMNAINKAQPASYNFLKPLLGLAANEFEEGKSPLGFEESHYYQFDMPKNETRGTFDIKTKTKDVPIELGIANILNYAKGMAEEANDGGKIVDTVITVPQNWNQRQRQAVVDAAQIAGLHALLVSETAASTARLGMDWSKPEGEVENFLLYNMGSTHVEVCVAEFTARAAGMVAGRTSPNIVIKACAHDNTIGGHYGDLKLAEEMKKRFIAKHPEMKDIEENKRSLRRLVSNSNKARHVLSANQQARWSCEGLHKGEDFQSTVTRAEFEEMMKPMFDRVADPIEEALKKANMTMHDIHTIEMLGSGWRAPKVQENINAYLESHSEKRDEKMPKLYMGQHLNGDEAMVEGASLIAANATRSIRPVKRVFYSDTPAYTIDMDILDMEKGEQIRNTTTLAAPGSRLGVKKKISISDAKQDFEIKVMEDGKLRTTWVVTGLEEALKSGDFKDIVNETDDSPKPKVTFTIGPDQSGIVTLSKKIEAVVVETKTEMVRDEQAMADRRKKNAQEKRRKEIEEERRIKEYPEGFDWTESIPLNASAVNGTMVIVDYDAPNGDGEKDNKLGVHYVNGSFESKDAVITTEKPHRFIFCGEGEFAKKVAEHCKEPGICDHPDLEKIECEKPLKVLKFGKEDHIKWTPPVKEEKKEGEDAEKKDEEKKEGDEEKKEGEDAEKKDEEKKDEESEKKDEEKKEDSEEKKDEEKKEGDEEKKDEDKEKN